ncbi:uncharacterized protein MYCFIDRAFT_139148 [Pseudocercospora fijiensis CIRAD86]|uniref:Ubiquitin-like domain-containing protein n=1 Tax=Pseudocercospora fijiensis (strain CIRAD86) TaxID=383855 RepID=M3AXG5_PSEFD|nr:uncharacterized protein MYCFIDRAFT_139148 [Pseudocercospora fijiensis CIRAD86]EME81773.1 hypothetical protein MYCFIDRAFT_139148 [Pseudocercospora fijiensis CIRAD86]
MSEVTFAKSFLATLDKKAIKLPADHVSDPRKYPNQSPYTLPKQTHPYPRKTGPTSTQQAHAKTISATLKPMKAGETVTLPNIALDSTIFDLKSQYASQTGLQQDKIKLLLNKKPAQDLKTLKDLGVEKDVEFSIMILGGAGSTPRAHSPAMEVDEKTPAPESEKAAVEAEKMDTSDDSPESIINTDHFWSDLQGFLTTRLKDEAQGERLSKLFRQAWSSSSTKP